MKIQPKVGPIEQRVLLPKQYFLRGIAFKAVEEMKVGDFRQVDLGDRLRFRYPLYRAARRLGMLITTRRMENGTIGIWRVK